MASIARRPDGRWRARYRDQSGREHSRHFSRKTDAQRWLDSVNSAVITGTYTDPRASGITMADWSETWLSGQVHLKATGRTRVEGIVRNYIVPRWGQTRLRDVSHEVPPKSWRVPYAASGRRAAVASNETGVIISAEL